VSERVLALQKTIKESVEAMVLEDEKRLLNISTALAQKDLRDQPIEKQAEEIAHMAGDLIQVQQKSKQAIGTVSDQSKVLEMRLKEEEDALQQTKLQIVEKDAQISENNTQLSIKDAQISDKDMQLKTLKDHVAQLEEQNKTLVEAKDTKAKTKKVKKISSTN
jgi:uncharacterized protein (DUF3084 family)